MEVVDLVHRHDVNQLLQVLHREEVAAHINHEAPIGEARFILYRTDGQGGQCLSLGDRQRFVKRLYAQEDSCLGSTPQRDTLGSDLQHVALRIAQARVELQQDGILAATGTYVHLRAGNLLNILRKEMGCTLQLGVALGITDFGRGAYHEGRNTIRLRDFVG